MKKVVNLWSKSMLFKQGKVGSRDRSIDLENALKMANSDGIVTYEEIRQNLKK